MRRVRDAWSKLTGKEKAQAERVLTEIEQLQQMYESALKEAVGHVKSEGVTAEMKNAASEGDGYETTADGINYSVKMSFAEQVDAALAHDLGRNTALYVTDTPEIMQALLNDYPMLMTQKHVRDMTLPKGSRDGAHGITETQAKMLPELLRDPVMMLNSLTHPGELVVVTAELDPDDAPIIVAIKPEGRGQYSRVRVASNFVKTMYGRNGFGGYISRTNSAGGVLYVNKKRTQALFAKVGVQFPQFLNRDGFFASNVAQFIKDVKGFQQNVQHSLKSADAPVKQEISSAKTSLKQIPALFKDKSVVFGKTNVDVGGGRFDLATNFLAERGTKNMVFDPYNRGAAENKATLSFLQSGKRADTATHSTQKNTAR